jgi:hypothetical protein
MKRLLFYLLLLALAVTAGFFLGYRKPAKEAKPPPSVSVVETNAVVKELPLHKGDPLVLRMETPRSKWKAVTVVPLQQGNTQPLPPLIDMGLAYEVLTLQPKLGPVKLPDLTLDAVLTPNRYGLGGSIPITEHVDLEAGLSRRWDDEQTERYIGVGFHLAF